MCEALEKAFTQLLSDMPAEVMTALTSVHASAASVLC